VRVVQLSDLHLGGSVGQPAEATTAIEWIAADPPDLVVLTGDLALVDPDDAADRAIARRFGESLGVPVVAIPGNHDVGFFDEPQHRRRRVEAFRETWGDDRFVVDADGWRLVGVDVYTVGDAEADGWLAASVDTAAPIALFVHQPLDAEPVDGWELPAGVRRRVGELLDGAGVRLVAAGHRHCAVVRDRPGGVAAPGALHVWAPSMRLVGTNAYHGGDPSPGAVEYRLDPDGTIAHRLVTFG